MISHLVNRLLSILKFKLEHFINMFGRCKVRRLENKLKRVEGPPDKRAYLSCLSQAIQDWEESHNSSEKQQSFPLLAMNSSVIVARLPEIGGAPLLERFEVGDYIALERLVTWENEPESYRSQPLFLAYSGDVNTLQTTHSVYMQGLKIGVPLAKWMPRYTPA